MSWVWKMWCFARSSLSFPLLAPASSSPFLESGRGKALRDTPVAPMDHRCHWTKSYWIKTLVSHRSLSIAHALLRRPARAAPVPPMETPNRFPLEKTWDVCPPVWAVACPFGYQSASCVVMDASFPAGARGAADTLCPPSRAAGLALSPWRPTFTLFLLFPCRSEDGCAGVCNRLRAGNARESPARASLPWRL